MERKHDSGDEHASGADQDEQKSQQQRRNKRSKKGKGKAKDISDNPADDEDGGMNSDE